jgi:protein-tyrosine phosphatase
MDRIINFRPLGKDLKNKSGKEIKENTIFRSGILTQATKKDQNRLFNLGIRSVYDLRSEEEKKKDLPYNIRKIKLYQYDILGNADPKKLVEKTNEHSKEEKTAFDELTEEKMNYYMDKLYADKFGGEHPFDEVLRQLTKKEKRPFLFHCSAGRDRTGVLGSLIMMTLDFDAEEIKKEYLRYDGSSVDILVRSVVQNLPEGAEIDYDKYNGIFSPTESNIDAYFNSVFSQYRSLDEYIKDVYGITEGVKSRFQKKYLK